MNAEAKQNLRFMLATQPHLSGKTVEELDALFKWVVGPDSNIVPVSSIQVVKS